MRIGAVLFDNANHVRGADMDMMAFDGAYASIQGGQARYIKSLHDLPTDVVWYTNIMFNDFSLTSLRNHPNFRSREWLRIRMDQLQNEFALDERNCPRSDAVQYLSALAARVVKICNRDFGLEPRLNTLADDLAAAFELPPSRVPENLQSAIHSLATHFSTQVVTDLQFTKRQPILTLAKNRVQHARELLAYPLPPDTNWAPVKNSGLGKAMTEDWIDSLKGPFLAKVRIRDINPAIADILSFGSGAKIVKEWITDVEWRAYRGHCRIEVISVFQPVDHESKPHELAQHIPPAGDVFDLSPTHGLMAENLWVAITRPGRRDGQHKRYTAAGAWLRSIDRVLMFNEALRLANMGLQIFSYGVGQITIKCPENEIGQIINIGARHGLMPARAKVIEHNGLMQTRPKELQLAITPPPRELGILTVDHHVRTKFSIADILQIDEKIIDNTVAEEEKKQFLFSKVTAQNTAVKRASYE